MSKSIVIELQREIVDSKISIVQLLRKALLIAKKLNLSEFENWIERELNGYKNEDEIPEYRKVHGEIKVYNPYNNIWLPIFFESPKEAEMASTRYIGQRITELEQISKKDDSGVLHVPFSKKIETILVNNLNLPSKPVLVVPFSTVNGIIETVRNILLDWTLKLEAEGILGEDFYFSEEEKDVANSNSQININNFQGILGNITNSHIEQSNTININKNDFNSLKNYLLNELKIPEDDINELEKAINNDPPPTESSKYGPKVSKWLGIILSKAASGLLNISVSSAASLIGNALSKYYGL